MAETLFFIWITGAALQVSWSTFYFRDQMQVGWDLLFLAGVGVFWPLFIWLTPRDVCREVRYCVAKRQLRAISQRLDVLDRLRKEATNG